MVIKRLAQPCAAVCMCCVCCVCAYLLLVHAYMYFVPSGSGPFTVGAQLSGKQERHELFPDGGVEDLAHELDVPFLGHIPLDHVGPNRHCRPPVQSMWPYRPCFLLSFLGSFVAATNGHV